MSDGNGGGTPQPTPQSAQGMQTLIDAGGNFTEGWRDKFAEFKGDDGQPILASDVLTDPVLNNFKNFGGLIKSLVHAQRAFGADKIVAPSEGASEEIWNEYYKRGGRPDTADGYDIKLDGTATALVSAEELKPWLSVFHQAGISTKQAKQIIDHYVKSAKTSIQGLENDATGERDKAKEALQKKWGLNNYDGNMSIVQAGLKQFDKAGVFEALGLHLEPEVQDVLYQIFSVIDEDKLVQGDVSKLGPVSIKAQINELMATEAYNQKKHPQHQDVKNKVTELFKQLHSE